MSLVSGTNYSIEVIDNKNVIINGNFDIWQRGTSIVSPINSDYTSDRFKYRKSGAMVHTVAQSTDVPTYAQSGTRSNYSLHLDVTTADAAIAAGEYIFMQYNVEGYDYARLAGGDATLSFWVKGAKTGIHCIAFSNSALDRSYIVEYTIAAADTWEKHTVTVPLTETAGTWDYTNGVGLRIDFTLVSGTTFQTTADTWQTGVYLATSNQVNEVDNVANNFRIAQVQLEKGDIATPLEFKSIADELGKCQRYYVGDINTGFHGYVSGTTVGVEVLVSLPVEMRGIPDVTKGTTASLINCIDGNITVGSSDAKNMEMNCSTWTAAGGCRIRLTGSSADAEL